MFPSLRTYQPIATNPGENGRHGAPCVGGTGSQHPSVVRVPFRGAVPVRVDLSRPVSAYAVGLRRYIHPAQSKATRLAPAAIANETRYPNSV